VSASGNELVELRNQQLWVNGKLLPLISGEVQFFRMDCQVWETTLLNLKKLRIPIVSTYLSWRRFEPFEGEFDFEGRTDPRLDLLAFIDLCIKHGLYLNVKPGPWICAEEKNGGYPDWLVEKSSLQVLDSNDHVVMGYNYPFQSPIPSYLHPDYLNAVERWMKAVDAKIKPFLYPKGPIILMQLDNEPCYTFHDAFFESDYNPVNTGENGYYQRWLKDRYSSIDVLNQAHGRLYQGFDQIQAPRSLEDIDSHFSAYLDWAIFKEDLLCRHVDQMGKFHCQNGVNGPMFTINYNLHPQLSTPNNWSKLEQVSGIGGFDYYPNLPMNWPDFVTMVLAVQYSLRVNQLPWSPEIMTGIWQFEGQENESGKIAPEAFRYLYLTCLAFGLKGLNFYMLADRDNWIDSPIDADGQLTRYAQAVEPVVKLMRLVPGFFEMNTEQPCGVLFNHRDARAAFIVNQDSNQERKNAYSRPYNAFLKMYELLLRANINPALEDLDVCDLDPVRRPFLVAFLHPKTQTELLEALEVYVDQGGTLILVTDCIAAVNGLVEQCLQPAQQGLGKRVAFHGQGKYLFLEGDAELQDLPQILQENGLRLPVAADNPEILTVLRTNESASLLFVINPGSEPQKTKVNVPGNWTFTELFPSLAEPSAQTGKAIELSARSIRVFMQDLG
jgi:beta-galactosidase GanA